MAARHFSLARISTVIAAGFLLCAASAANAAPVIFNYSGTSADPTGFSAMGSFTIDSSVFDGTGSQLVSHSEISSLSYTVETPFAGTMTFSTADIVTTASTQFDSTSGTPVITSSFGDLAVNGPYGIFLFFVDGLEAYDLDDGDPFIDYFGPYDVTTVPIPAAIWLFGSALAGFGMITRKRKKAA